MTDRLFISVPILRAVRSLSVCSKYWIFRLASRIWDSTLELTPGLLVACRIWLAAWIMAFSRSIFLRISCMAVSSFMVAVLLPFAGGRQCLVSYGSSDSSNLRPEEVGVVQCEVLRQRHVKAVRPNTPTARTSGRGTVPV